MTSTPRKKLIEVSIPLEAINEEAIWRKQKAPKGFPTAIHKYWAQRPIATCRGVLFAQLVDDPSAWPERFPTEEAQAIERRRLHRLIERLVPWDASNNTSILNEARWEIARSVAWGLGEEPPEQGNTNSILSYLQEKAPPVHDPFSGSGSIPLEAQRLGLRAYGSDLNPVAVVIGKALVEIPPKFAGLPPVNPRSQAELERGSWNGSGAQGLAEDVRYYGQWMRDEAERRIGHYYPRVELEDGSEGLAVAWLWARTVRSPDPAAKGAMVPLVSSFILSNKEGKKAWVEPTIDPSAKDGWLFRARTGTLSKSDEDQKKTGTKTGRGTNFLCLLSGAAISPDYIREEGMGGRLGVRLMAVVADSPAGRVYLSPTPQQEQLAADAKPGDTSALEVEMPDNPRWFSPPGYGFKRYVDIFTPRQLLALTTFSDLVGEARKKAKADADLASRNSPISGHVNASAAYADAVATYLAFVVDRMAFYGSSLCGWLPKDNAMGKTMPQQALAMSWDFAEGNPFGKSSADITTCTRAISDVISELRQSSMATVVQSDAAEVQYQPGALISTDPPYYDNVGYADLSDFFYCWMRRTLLDVYPDLFRRLVTPKDAELVATPYRHKGPDAAEAFFMEGMKDALRRMSRADGTYPFVIYYAYKQQEAAQAGITSAGWASFLQAIVDANFMIDATWPVRTESPTRSIARGTNALASSIVLVCSGRAEGAARTDRAGFTAALRRDLPDAIAKIRTAGVGSVDMQQSVLGPGMGVFTRYSEVLDDDDKPLPVKAALAIINRVWQEIDSELVASFDPPTQVALAWFESYGFDAHASGELITIATAKNTSIEEMFSSEVFQNLRGKAKLTVRENLPSDWSPSRDRHLTVWECVQHTARVLGSPEGGAVAAGRLIAEMGPIATDARALLDRLFHIATDRGWAQEALVYNQLAEEWPHLLEQAANAPSGADTPTTTSDLFA